MNRQLVEVVQQMAATYDLEPLLKSIELAANGLLPCTRAQIMQYDAGSEEFFDQSNLQARISARVGASARAAATRRTIRVGTSSQQETLVVPLIAPEGDLMGVLHVLGPTDHRFSEEESELALTLGALAAIAMKRQALVDQAAETRRLERELALAREIVRPPATPEVPGFALSGRFHPAQQVGGDLYDFRRLADGRLMLLVADASGHGLDSALIGSRCRAYFRALMTEGGELTAVAGWLNELLLQDLEDDERFVAASLGCLDCSTGRLEVVGLGQTCCIYLPASGEVEVVDPSGPPLGVFGGLELEARVLELSAGDVVAFYTDGLADWRNAAGECFGEERVSAALQQWRTAPDLAARLYEEARRFAGGRAQPDDVTCLVLRAE